MVRERLPFAGTFRAAATFCVVCYHVWLADIAVKHVQGPAFLTILGAFAVACFFALSGFLLALPYVAAFVEGRKLPAWTAFARDRFLRIYPLYAFAVITLVLLNVPNPGIHPGDAHDVISHLTFTFVFNHESALTIDPPMWTMATDVQFYVLLPVLFAAVAFFDRKRRLAVLAASVVVLVAASIVWRLAHASAADAALQDFALKVIIFEQLPAMFTAFGGGILGAIAWYKAPRERRTLLGIAALLFALPFLYYGLNNLVPYIVMNDVFCGAGAAGVLVAGCALLPNRLFESKPVMWAERLSYGVYLFHFFVVDYVRQFTAPLPPWPYFFATAALAYVATSVLVLPMYLWIERPFLVLKSVLNKRAEHYLEPAA
ncbi:MAG TPA: acyltransferase [Candidatus Baltobacteraceae bacterium]|jgi:peptidoglycan/LPS O-acetylase OafA/YrhL|nr:acyltransferase [Candidatus Baltobacteraceae bacterium]